MNIDPIGTLITPFSDKFSIPRQAGMVQTAIGELHLNDLILAQSLQGLEQHSHLWVIWGFHKHYNHHKSPMVRPPRLGGNKKLGVFATRSSFRQNNLALSVYPILSIDQDRKTIHLSGVDCLSNSPVFDIKPYLPYSDCIPHAVSGFASQKPNSIYKVSFTEIAMNQLEQIPATKQENLKQLLLELLQYDVAPAYQKKDEQRIYASTIYKQNIKWYYKGGDVIVCAIE